MKLATIVVTVMLASCASSGLYNMSDAWCSAHLNASAARCPEKKDEDRRVADNQRARIVANESSQRP
jgi:hypothetical protein